MEMHGDTSPDERNELVLVTGVTGYVGGRLAGRFVDAGVPVRVLVRGGADRIAGRSWSDAVDVAVADVSETSDVDPPPRLVDALRDVTTAYYLIHSMRVGSDFDEQDLECARRFAAACDAAGVDRIVYLGGLGDDREDLSKHLHSRHETGRALAEGKTPVIELRAAVIVGSGSLSFEIIRHLAERLPVMIFPKWASTQIQPIGIADVLSYLIAARERPRDPNDHEVIEIGGPTVETFGGMILRYAEARGLKRFAIRVPLITPRLSSYWLHWTTPVTATIARPLIEGASHEVIVRDTRATEIFPNIEPLTYREALQRALARIDQGDIETIWSDSQTANSGRAFGRVVAEEQGLLIESREGTTHASTDEVFLSFCSLGGVRGWPLHWLWRIRGWMDQMVGGVGLRRGRRDPETLRAGDALDFWRVEEIEPGKRLLLRAEMKVPGEAWLRFETTEADEQHAITRITQTAFFAPRGLLGRMYWYAIYPVHGPVFGAMLQTVIERSEERFDANPLNRAANTVAD